MELNDNPTQTDTGHGIARWLGWIALAMVCAAAPASRAGEALDFRVYPMPNGAPVALVHGMLQDREGAVWVVTWGEGAHRIHGTEWRSYTEADGLPDDWIRSIAEARDGGVWLGTGEGLALVKEGRITTLTRKELPLLGTGDVSFARELENGTLVTGTLGGTILVRDPNGTLPADLEEGWRVLVSSEATRGKELADLVEISSDIWVGALSWGGVGWWRNGTWSMDPKFNNFGHYVLHERTEQGQRQIWLAERDSGLIHRLEGEDWVPLEAGPPGINDYVEVDGGGTFAATLTGLFHRDADAWHRYTLDPALGTPEVNRLLSTADGALWAGGREGLLRGTLHTWIHPATPGGPTVLLPRSRTSDPLLAIDFDGVLYSPEGTGWKRTLQLDPWIRRDWTLDDSIWMGDGRLWNEPGAGLRWIMVANGQLHTICQSAWSIYGLDDGRLRETRTLPPTDPTIERFYITAGGSLLYMAQEGVFRLEEGAWTPFPTTPGYTQRHAYSLRETEPGTFWAGIAGGLERWTGERIELFSTQEGVQPDDDIHAILPSRGGDLWFASMGAGLYRFDGARFHQYTKSDGLMSNSVRAIFERENGTLWIANRSTGISALRGGRWVHYGLEHGLPHAPTLAFAETAEGVLWIGTRSDGLLRYRPDQDPPDTEIALGPKQIDAHGIAVFSFTGRDAWNQTPIRDLHFAWRVVGPEQPDEPWSAYGLNTTVATPPLPHGEYQFEVRASDENGNEDPTPASVRFTVLPPLWLKPGFFVPVSLSAALALIALAFLWISRRALLRSEAALRSEVTIRTRAEALLEQHSENLEEIVAERTRVLADVQEELIRKERLATLGQLTATVSHELRNPLGTIQSSLFLIEKRVRGLGLNVEPALERTARSVRRCDKIIEELLDFTRANEIVPQTVQTDPWLREALDDIGAPERVTLTLDLDCPACVRIDRELMRRVLINLLDNAVQAMNEDPGPERAILIRSALREGRAEITMEDTGPGIAPEALDRIFEPLFSTKNFGIGLGTNIMRNIMLRHNGGIEYANRADRTGARVLIWLPACGANDPG